MTNDGKSLDNINLTDEQLEKIKSILEQERIKGKVVEKQNVKSAYDYDFSKVNLRDFSKKKLIRIIHDLKNRLDRKESEFLKIEVYDKALKRKHIVGTDIHDVLLVNNGVVEYYNLQNGEGTGGDYEFVEKGLYDE